MDTKSSSVETKIIEATIECIERYGIQGVTNRKIAEIAGINSAAVNYYFRSKETLIKRVMETTLDNAFDWEDIELLPGDTAQQRCAAIFNELIEGGCNFPGITRAHFYEVIAGGNYDSLAVERLNEFIQKLAQDMQTRGAGLDEQETMLACVQIASAALLMGLAPRLFEKKTGMDMNDAETRQRFVARLVERLL